MQKIIPPVYKQFDDVLPEIFHERLLEAQYTGKLWDFFLGDAVNDIWSWVQKEKVVLIDPLTHDHRTVTLRFVCGWVAKKLDDDKRGADSIYEFSNLAGIYKSKSVRLKYARLPISHLKYATRFPAMYHILAYDLSILDKNGGRPQSLLELMKHFEPEKFTLQASNHQIDDERLFEQVIDEIHVDFAVPADLPVNQSELRELNEAFDIFRRALVTFNRRNPAVSIRNLLDMVSDLYSDFMKQAKSRLQDH